MAPLGQASLLLGALAGLSGASLTFDHQRHTVNFGAELPHKHYAAAHHESSEDAISAFLAATSGFRSASAAAAAGQASAEATSRDFVRHLHPNADFKVQSQVYSAHNKVLSTHYVQQVYDPITRATRDVVNGLVNVNVDTTSGDILSYGDSAWKGRVVCSDLNNHVAAQQQVLGQTSDEPTCETIYTGNEAKDSEFVPDPRLAMISFLRIGNPSLAELDQDTLALLETIQVVPHESMDVSGEDQPWGYLHNVPGAVEPVSAKLAYVQTQDEGLDLVWSLEYQSNSNWYEAHMKAVLTPEADEPAPLLVADWMKDSPAPKPDNKKAHEDVPLYRVFPWGMNDPVSRHAPGFSCHALTDKLIDRR